MKTIIKPKRRSELRLFLGAIYYRLMRYWQWFLSSTKFALEQEDLSGFPHLIANHQAPLYRKLSNVDMWLQHNKVINLKLAISKLNGIVVRPGETFSFWRLVGLPSRRRGFVDGMVLFNGTVRPGVGGGLCQLSNLIYWITLHSPLTVTERWRHSYDVFPDSDRSQPFGSGATVSYNHIDLQIRNDTRQNFILHVFLTEDSLIGEWRSNESISCTYRVYEKEHAITHEYWGGYVRHNRINREVYNENGLLIRDEPITDNHAIMMYQPFLAGDAENII